MFRLEEFRAGQYGLPFSCRDELPPACWVCIYLLFEEGDAACLCDSPSFYFCGYTWPDKITQTIPPCLQEVP